VTDRSRKRFFAARGFSLHAATRIDADDRAGLERLIRYATSTTAPGRWTTTDRR